MPSVHSKGSKKDWGKRIDNTKDTRRYSQRVVRYLHTCSSSPTVESNSIWTQKDTDWTAPHYSLKRNLRKQEGKKNLTGRAQCVQVCVCALAVDKCKVAAIPKDNPVFTFRYCRKSYITQRYCLLKSCTLLQSQQRFFYYIFSRHSATEFSGKIGRKW